MSTSAPIERPSTMPTVSPTPAPPPKQLGTVRLEVSGLSEVQDALSKASTRIDYLEAENKKLRTENQTLQDALSHWQGVVRVAREKDSTLPDPEAASC